MKVVVYAICKNEVQFAARWMESMKEADGVYVLDTGSDDGTAEKLRELGAHVTVEKITPWRFEAARNRSLDLTPEDADVCVCTDLDEVFRPGWRQGVEDAMASPEVLRLYYRYTWSFLPDGREGSVFWISKIHRRHGFRWKHPVHEVLVCEGQEPPRTYAEQVRLEHYPDYSKPRSQYLPLLELAVVEEPEDDRNVHYLGREYYYYQRWEEAIIVLKRHLTLPTAGWVDERCASMRMIAKCYRALENTAAAEQWYLRAAAEAPHLREPWMDLANFAAGQKAWGLLLWAADRALSIKERPRTYIAEANSWGGQPWDYKALGHFYLGQYKKALEAAETAAKLEPDNQRIQENLRLIRAKA